MNEHTQNYIENKKKQCEITQGVFEIVDSSLVSLYFFDNTANPQPSQ